jgi:hypothetical protein
LACRPITTPISASSPCPVPMRTSNIRFRATLIQHDLFFFFLSTGVWTQGFALARQMLYHLRHASNLFLLWLFWTEGLIFCLGWSRLWSSYFISPDIARMTGACHQDQLFPNFFAWNSNFPDLSFLCSLGWQAWATSVLAWHDFTLM